VSTQSQMAFAGAMLVALCGIAPAEPGVKGQLSPADLVKAVIRSEMNPAAVPDARWKYLVDKEVDGKQETREVVETKSGSLDRLLAIAGRPLTGSAERAESERIIKLSRDPGAQHQFELSHRKDAAQCKTFLQMIPDAFLFEYAGASADLVKLAFKPNPNFQPSSREGKVLHEMAGEIWVDARQMRLVSLSGQLINEVKFAGGLLGHLEKGGRFSVKRAEISPGHWEVKEIVVNMQGKVLLFKSISVQQKELHSNFQPVPDDLTLFDAAGLLLKQALVAAKQ